MNYETPIFSAPLKVGSRQSPLAIKQVEEVFSLLKEKGLTPAYDSVKMPTRGDHDKTTSLTVQPADDFFTNTLDEALLKKEIDIAIHSAKDLPKSLLKGLEIFALTSALDETDALVSKMKLAELPAGAKVGTSSLIRQKMVKQINSGIEPVDIRGTIEERLKLIDNGKLDGVIVATCALKRLGLDQRITEIMSWEATPLQGQLAIVGRQGDHKLKEIFSRIDVRKNFGRVFLVGAGPGDPELITVKGVNILKRADCVLYDYLVDPKLLEYAPQAEKMFVGKRKGEHSMPQSELSRLLRDKARAGKTVVRLKSGDPLVFGRGGDEIAYLSQYHIEVEVVPGVSSATGIPSLLGVPLTARGVSSSVAFLSGYSEDERAGELKPLAIPKVDTIVFLMALTKLPFIVKSLRDAGWREDAPLMIISKGTTPQEKVLTATLKDVEERVAENPLDPPALIVAGEVVRFFRQPAQKQEDILYLGTNPEKYQPLGNLVHLPMIDIIPVNLQPEVVAQLLKELPRYDLILLTSRCAVKYFMETLLREKVAPQTLKAEWVVIGDATAETLREFGITPRWIADPTTSEGMFELLKSKYDLKGRKILFPRSSLPNPYLRSELTKLGAEVRELTIYQNIKPQTKEMDLSSVGKVIFTSPSTVKNFLETFGTIPDHWQILSKGPSTNQTLQEAGYESEVLIHE